MKRIAVLCPGPSLRTTWPYYALDNYDLVIGVNHVGCEVDYQVASDWQTLDTLRHHPRLGWVVPKATLFYHPNIGPRVITYESFATVLPMTPPQCNFSGIAALVVASTFHAKIVDVYGMDLVATPEPGRDEARFRRERQHVSETLDKIRCIPFAPEYRWVRP
jgi:hypothetical protein